MKSKAVAIFLGTMMVLNLAACGGTASTSDGEAKSDETASTSEEETATDTTEKSDDASGKTIIKFAAQDDTTGGFQAGLDAFNASQDQYEAQWVVLSNDSGEMRDQLNTALSAGSSEYDVMALDVVWAGDMASAGYIDPLDSYMKDDKISAASFNAGSMASGSVNGKQYTLPFWPDAGMLFYRTDIVSEEDSAKLVSGDYTWDDLLAMAEEYSGQGGTSVGLTFQAAQYEGLVCNLVEFTNGFTDVKGGLETMKKATDADYTPADILNYQENETCVSFYTGESVFGRNWPYMWGEIQTNGSISTDVVGIAPMPTGSCIGGWLLSMNTNSKNKDGAWELIKYLSSYDGQVTVQSITGNVPGYNEAMSDETLKKSNPLLESEGLTKAFENTLARPVSDNYTETSDTIQQTVHKYLSGEQDLDTTVSAVEAALKN